MAAYHIIPALDPIDPVYNPKSEKQISREERKSISRTHRFIKEIIAQGYKGAGTWWRWDPANYP